jgi:hypothetical protein
VYAFFFDFKKRTAKHYEVLFDGGDRPSDSFAEKWNWYAVLYSLSGEDVLKMDAVSDLSVGAAFTHLAFKKDLDYKMTQSQK